MNEFIKSFDDVTARHVLLTIAKAYSADEGFQVDIEPGMVEALEEEFVVASAAKVGSEGELAREALLMLGQEPRVLGRIESLAKNPAPEQFAVGTTMAIITAALIILQTHVRFERTQDGHWTLKVEKKATRDNLLKPLVQRLVSAVKVGLGDGSC